MYQHAYYEIEVYDQEYMEKIISAFRLQFNKVIKRSL